MYKVGVVGDKESVLGFLALGMEAFPVQSGDEAQRTLKSMIESGYALIYITEDFWEAVEEIAEKASERLTPAIIPIPSAEGSRGIGKNKVKRSAVRAVGSDILFNG